MAEHFYNLFSALAPDTDSLCQIKAVDLLYEIGQHLLQDGRNGLAAKWLGRACFASERIQDSCNATDFNDLRLNVLHTYGKH